MRPTELTTEAESVGADDLRGHIAQFVGILRKDRGRRACLRRANVDRIAAGKVLNADARNAPVSGAECVLDAVVRKPCAS